MYAVRHNIYTIFTSAINRDRHNTSWLSSYLESYRVFQALPSPVTSRRAQYRCTKRAAALPGQVGGTDQLRTANSGITSVCVADVELPVADEIKVLGVVLDRRLAFDKHVMEVIRSCSFLRLSSEATHCIPI